MVRITRRGSRYAGIAMMVSIACFLLISLGRADDTKTIDEQKAKQKSAQSATEDVIQRMGTMLRIMEYYQPDRSQERKTLERVALTLVGLSREQMEEVLKALDKAVQQPDANKSAKELTDAHARHIEIMQTLRELLAAYSKVNSLDQLADKLDKLARAQLELALTSSKILKELEDGGIYGLSRQRDQEFTVLEVEQGNIRKDVKDLLAKAGKLKATLPSEQQELLDTLVKAADKVRVLQTMDKAELQINHLRYQIGEVQVEGLPDAAALQRKAAEDLKDLAALLRQPNDELVALRKAQDHLDEVIGQEQQLRDNAKEQAEAAAKANQAKAAQPIPEPPQFQFQRGFGGKGKGMKDHIYNTPPMVDARGKELSDQQARVALDMRDATNLLKPIDRELALAVDANKVRLKVAEDALRKNQVAKAIPPQDKAIDGLKDARAKVAELIAQAEGRKIDPLAVLKNLAEQLDKLLKDQIATRDQTQTADETKQPNQLPQIAPKQFDLAQKTDALNDAPVALNKETQKAIDKAARAMDKATQNLQQTKADPAIAKQNDAIQSLKDAQKNLADQIAEIEKRREDIAKLQQASEKLDELTKKEGQIADKAKEAEPNTKDLAAKQDQLTPKAKDLAKDLNQTAPKASDKINEGAEKMEAAKNQLDKNQADPGAKEAMSAVEKLKQAQDELAKRLDDLKAKELAQQAALQKSNPSAAMQHLQKAIEQTLKAMRQAQQALNAEQQKSLAQMQKDLADKAKEKTFDEASMSAASAAKSLQSGDLDQALQNQQKAFDKLVEDHDQASKAAVQAKGQENPDGQPAQTAQAKEGSDKPGEAREPRASQPSQVKEGQPQPGQDDGPRAEAKQGDSKDGAQGQPKDSADHGANPKIGSKAKAGEESQQGQAKQAQATAAQAKAGPEAGQGEAKAGPPGQGAGPLADEQKALMDATMQLAQQQKEKSQPSQQSNQGAMQALGQAMATSPQGMQMPLQQAANQLGKAGQQLGQGSPEQAMQSQQKALQQMLKALQQTEKTQKLAKGEEKDQKPGEGKEKGMKPGEGEKPGEGKKGMEKGQGKGQAKGQQKGQGNAEEKNERQGKGDRIADGKVSNSASQMNDITGTDTFLQLPPRQRELIRQALAGDLPPEYAAQIQQYYLNVSRGRSAVFPTAPK